MNDDTVWPKVGDALIHDFRNGKRIVAEVLSVDRTAGEISLRVGRQSFSSLSAAARAVSGFRANGWVFWGLKKAKGKEAK